jgi:hypothetical protein
MDASGKRISDIGADRHRLRIGGRIALHHPLLDPLAKIMVYADVNLLNQRGITRWNG